MNVTCVKSISNLMKHRIIDKISYVANDFKNQMIHENISLVILNTINNDYNEGFAYENKENTDCVSKIILRRTGFLIILVDNQSDEDGKNTSDLEENPFFKGESTHLVSNGFEHDFFTSYKSYGFHPLSAEYVGICEIHDRLSGRFQVKNVLGFLIDKSFKGSVVNIVKYQAFMLQMDLENPNIKMYLEASKNYKWSVSDSYEDLMLMCMGKILNDILENSKCEKKKKNLIVVPIKEIPIYTFMNYVNQTEVIHIFQELKISLMSISERLEEIISEVTYNIFVVPNHPPCYM